MQGKYNGETMKNPNELDQNNNLESVSSVNCKLDTPSHLKGRNLSIYQMDRRNYLRRNPKQWIKYNTKENRSRRNKFLSRNVINFISKKLRERIFDWVFIDSVIISNYLKERNAKKLNGLKKWIIYLMTQIIDQMQKCICEKVPR